LKWVDGKSSREVETIGSGREACMRSCVGGHLSSWMFALPHTLVDLNLLRRLGIDSHLLMKTEMLLGNPATQKLSKVPLLLFPPKLFF